eukprot:765928-Hanusia_phi.AAC.2
MRQSAFQQGVQECKSQQSQQGTDHHREMNLARYLEDVVRLQKHSSEICKAQGLMIRQGIGVNVQASTYTTGTSCLSLLPYILGANAARRCSNAPMHKSETRLHPRTAVK